VSVKRHIQVGSRLGQGERRTGEPPAGEPPAGMPPAGRPGPDRMHAVLRAVGGISGELEPNAVLRRIVEAAVELTGARYGALGILGDGGRLSGFIPVGLAESQIAEIHHWPEGHGLLGELIAHPRLLRSDDISAHPSSAGFPPGHPPMRSFLGVPVRIRGEVFGHLYLADKRGGGPFDENDEAIMTAVASAAALAVENARLRAESRRQRQWQRATAEVTQRLLSEDEPRDVLTLVTEHALEISGADSVMVSLPSPAGDHLVVEQVSGTGSAVMVGLTFPADTSLSGLVMATGQPVILDDFDTDDRVHEVIRSRVGLGPAVVVPLGLAGDVRGVMMAARRSGAQPLSPAAIQMVTTFAAQAGIGLKLAEHRRDAQGIAVLADRDRIARDLHDLVIQRLFATGMSLQGATPLVSEPGAADRIRRAVDELDDTIRDIRSAIYTLQSRDEAEQPGMRARIVAVTEEMTPALGFAPSLRVDGLVDSRVPAQIAEDMLVALREALSNAARHAHASLVEVTFEADLDLSVVVRDNGAGIGPAVTWSGLANLTDRAAELGGSLSVTPADGGGTRLEWRIPLPHSSAPPADGPPAAGP
jgi:signal transduction histidine kinase